MTNIFITTRLFNYLILTDEMYDANINIDIINASIVDVIIDVTADICNC